MAELNKIWFDLAGKYSNDVSLIEKQWIEIEQAYSEDRFYHNLSHLSFMIDRLEQCKSNVENYDVVLFAVFYHDIVYKAQKKDNEKRSAMFAEKRMLELGVDPEAIKKCYDHIIATKLHEATDEMDCQYFLDADMAILGSSKEEYREYTYGVRKEYSVFPDILYNPGRKKVLHHFLEMSSIYQTDFFKDNYEKQARLNIEWELTSFTSS